MRARKRELDNSFVRRKSKRLDAISDEIYNQYRSVAPDLNETNADTVPMSPYVERRRSSRVRRAPVILDTSPQPVKKQKKIGKNDDAVIKVEEESADHLPSVSSEAADGACVWRSRLRSRSGNCSLSLARCQPPSGRRKLFDVVECGGKDVYVQAQPLNKVNVDSGNSTIMKSRRSRKIRAINPSMNLYEETKKKNEENGINSIKEPDKGETFVEPQSPSRNGLNSPGRDTNETAENLKGSNETHSKKYVDLEALDNSEKEAEVPTNAQQRSRKMHGLPVIRPSNVKGEDKSMHMRCDMESEKPLEGRLSGIDQPLNSADAKRNCKKDSSFRVIDQGDQVGEDACNLQKIAQSPGHKLSTWNLKEGRRCALCGGGMDGKPPKRLIHDMGESENEECSGSSVSEEPNYDIWDGFGDEPCWLGRLLGPVNDRFGIARIWIHQNCAVWSPEVYFSGLGCLKNIRTALSRGRGLKCTRCGRTGATSGCRVDKCLKTYHLPCARANGCHFDHRAFLIACTDHKKFFQPHGNQYLAMIKKMKAKKMKLEMRKVANDAFRKDLEAEEKWLEKCGEDEEFIKRESKRLHRDLLRIAPVYVGGPHSENASLFQGWESVAGLQNVIHSLKEVVLLPLLYPDFFTNMGLQPPRGVLLHGHPGTGKTLIVRALIGSCSRGDKRIAYFSRKGADCLGKYVGDAERQLRLLFQVAEKSQPSIIFFDEIDGLAPCRTRQQDQTHNSVVSTLLALMDGLKSRGSVVVIGATNRPEAVDPALRRPGRFDREVYFPLPSVKDRDSILSLHTQKWPKPISGPLLKWIAENTDGFAGADLQALCTQAAMVALKRRWPLQKLLRTRESSSAAIRNVVVVECDWLDALACMSPPCSRRDASANDVARFPIQLHLLPFLLQPLCSLLIYLYDQHAPLSYRVRNATEKIKAIFEAKGVSISCMQELLVDGDVTFEILRTLSHSGIIYMNENSCSDPVVNEDDDPVNLLKNAVPEKSSGTRILVAGAPKSGQIHIASCLLYCIARDVEVRKVDAATISRDRHGDVGICVARMLASFAGMSSCLIFMPRIDLWAVESSRVGEDPDNLNSVEHVSCARADVSGQPERIVFESSLIASHAWILFAEQFQSLPESSSFMLLATSEIPYDVLPRRIREFFHSGMSTHRLPHLVVQLDRDLDSDKMLSYYVPELVRALIQVFILFIHKKYHVTYGLPDTELNNVGLTLCNESDAKSHDPRPLEPALQNPLQSPKRKANLRYAIFTLGYQILHSPQFADLCWITSKLKEGPFAEIPRVLKRWLCNSCVIHPSNSDEKFDIVRGLIAVGLSAYRGAYSSSRNVSRDIHEVLSLLSAEINSRIQTKNDRYRFIAILSQVGYVKDIINSWAFSVQSLESEEQIVADSSMDLRPLGENPFTSCHEELLNEEAKGSPEQDTGSKCAPQFSGLSEYSDFVCLYSCCSGCMHSLNGIVWKAVMNAIKTQHSLPTVEDMHDFISSLSARLISDVRDSISANWIQVVLENCIHHSEVDNRDCENKNFYAFRSGLLVAMDSDKTDNYHCKFEKLCLCSLISCLLRTWHLNPIGCGGWQFSTKYSKSVSSNVETKR